MNWFCQTTKRWKTEGYGSSGVILWTNMATTGTNRGRFLLWHVKGKQLARLYINSMETHKCHKPNVKCLLKNVFEIHNINVLSKNVDLINVGLRLMRSTYAISSTFFFIFQMKHSGNFVFKRAMGKEFFVVFFKGRSFL